MCGMNAKCTDTEGSYMCTCSDGFTGNGSNCSGETAAGGYQRSQSINFFISLQMLMSVSWTPVSVVLDCVSTLRGVMSVHVPLATCGMKQCAMVNCSTINY